MTWAAYYQEQVRLLHESGLFRRIRWTEARKRRFYALCLWSWLILVTREAFKDLLD